MNTAIATRCVPIPWNIKTLGPYKIKAIKVGETVDTDSGWMCWLILKYYLRVNCYNFSASAPDHQDSFQSFCQHLQELHVYEVGRVRLKDNHKIWGELHVWGVGRVRLKYVWGDGRVRFKDIHKIFLNISNISFVSIFKTSMSEELAE